MSLSADSFDRLHSAPPTEGTLLRFITALVDSGSLNHEQGRLMSTAVRKAFGALSSAEPQDATFVARNLEELFTPARHPGVRPGTLTTYRSRAGKAIDAFLEFREHPTRFAERRTRSAPTKERKHARERTLPLGADDRVFRFVLPEDGVTRSDVQRIALHLWSVARDFDGSPLMPSSQLELPLRGSR